MITTGSAISGSAINTGEILILISNRFLVLNIMIAMLLSFNIISYFFRR